MCEMGQMRSMITLTDVSFETEQMNNHILADITLWAEKRMKMSKTKLPGLYKLANSCAPLCCGPHRGIVCAILCVLSITSFVVDNWQFALGSSSSIEFSKICFSVFTGA